MSILKSIMHHWNSTSESYDTLHPETEYAQVTDFGEGTIANLISSALASTVTACSTGSVFGKLVEKLLDASGMRYNFSNSSEWYICLGSLFGGLIIQGGRTTTVTGDSSGKSISFPITFSESPAFLATLGQPSALPNTYGIITNVNATTAVVWVVNDNTWKSATIRWAAFGS